LYTPCPGPVERDSSVRVAAAGGGDLRPSNVIGCGEDAGITPSMDIASLSDL